MRGEPEAKDSRANGRQTSEVLSYPNSEHVCQQEGFVDMISFIMVHEQVVDGGSDPGRNEGDAVDPGEVGDADVGPRQDGGN